MLGDGQPLSGDRRTVVVVDDEPDVRSITQRVLEYGGFRVVTAAAGAEALALLERHAGDTVGLVLDVSLPGMAGEEVLRRARESWPRLPVVLTSGYDADQLGNLPVGPTCWFLRKPYAPEELLACIRAMLATNRAPVEPEG